MKVNLQIELHLVLTQCKVIMLGIQSSFVFLVRDQLSFFFVQLGFSGISKMLHFDRVFCSMLKIKRKKKRVIYCNLPQWNWVFSNVWNLWQKKNMDTIGFVWKHYKLQKFRRIYELHCLQILRIQIITRNQNEFIRLIFHKIMWRQVLTSSVLIFRILALVQCIIIFNLERSEMSLTHLEKKDIFLIRQIRRKHYNSINLDLHH